MDYAIQNHAYNAIFNSGIADVDYGQLPPLNSTVPIDTIPGMILNTQKNTTFVNDLSIT